MHSAVKEDARYTLHIMLTRMLGDPLRDPCPSRYELVLWRSAAYHNYFTAADLHTCIMHLCAYLYEPDVNTRTTESE